MKNSKTEIFKLQKPVAYGTEILIYNEDRSYMGQCPINTDMKRLFGRAYKIYVTGYVDKDGLLHIDKKVKQQDW